MKPGYKQTEVGIIPEEWVVSLLADVITSFQNGFAFASHGYVKSGIPIVTMAQIGLDGRFNFTSESVNYWPTEAASALRAFQLFRGDIIIAMTDVTPQKNLIGRMAEVTEIGPLLLNQRVGLFRLDAKKIDPYFLRAMSNSSRWRGYARAVASLGVQANIGTNDIRAGKLPLPPLPEQRAIATALSDVDGLLGGLDRLIAKKRDLKQAAMQQLLTGQTRLPGFNGEWEVKRLGNMGSTYGGLTGKTKADFGEGPARYITFMNVMSNVVIDCGTFEQVQVSPTESQNRAKKGDLFFNGSSETPEEVAMCSVLHDEVRDVYLNSFCFGFRFHDGAEADGLFLAYYLRSKEGRELMKSLAQGSTRYNLSKVALLKSPLRLPELPEQTAIASVLSEMDGELAVLEQRREKTRALKQAMMQELLTGRTRLV